MPGPVQAMAGVSFKGESGSRLKLLQFSTQSRTQDAWNYYAGLNQLVHSDDRLLLVSNRSMGQEWFEKYQDGIFKQ
jgi:hypothetical protein